MAYRVAVRCFAASVFFMTMVADAPAATPKVGVASAVQNSVLRIAGAGTQPLSVGSDLFTNERIRTGEASTAQILFLDKTSLTIGPRFVYNPSNGTGQVVLNTVRGSFRFISGSQSPRNYTIKTPVGNIGIRGTIVDLDVQDGRVIVILVRGLLNVMANGRTHTLSKPGTALIFLANGDVQGPVTWDGSIFNTGGTVSFPLHGWHFQGEPLVNGLPSTNVGTIDQLNGIIQRSLTPPRRGGGGGD